MHYEIYATTYIYLYDENKCIAIKNTNFQTFSLLTSIWVKCFLGVRFDFQDSRGPNYLIFTLTAETETAPHARKSVIKPAYK